MSKPKSIGLALFDMGVEQAAQPDKPIAYHALPPDDNAPFLALLAEYADGQERREEVIAAVWQWDDPLQRQIRAALVAAEAHGEWKARNF